MMHSSLRFASAIGYLCGGLLIWAGLFLVMYIFAAIACARTFSHAVWLGMSVVPALLAGAAAAALGVLFALARRADALQDGSARRSDDTHRLVAQVGLTVCGLALLAIVWNILPVLLVVSRC